MRDPSALRPPPPPPPHEELYRIDMSCMAGPRSAPHGPMPCYLVRATSPQDAIEAAEEQLRDRWPDAREVEVLRIWRYSATGRLVLGGAGQLEPGDPVLRSEYLPASGRGAPAAAPNPTAAAPQGDSEA